MCAHTTCIAPNAGALQLAATIRRAHKAARWAAARRGPSLQMKPRAGSLLQPKRADDLTVPVAYVLCTEVTVLKAGQSTLCCLQPVVRV